MDSILSAACTRSLDGVNQDSLRAILSNPVKKELEALTDHYRTALKTLEEIKGVTLKSLTRATAFELKSQQVQYDISLSTILYLKLVWDINGVEVQNYVGLLYAPGTRTVAYLSGSPYNVKMVLRDKSISADAGVSANGQSIQSIFIRLQKYKFRISRRPATILADGQITECSVLYTQLYSSATKSVSRIQ